MRHLTEGMEEGARRPHADEAEGAGGRPDATTHGAAVHAEVREADGEVIVRLGLGWAGSISVHCGPRTLEVEADRYTRPCEVRRTTAGWRQGHPFRREIPLPCEVRPDEARAHYRHGVLTVRVPRSAAAVPSG